MCVIVRFPGMHNQCLATHFASIVWAFCKLTINVRGDDCYVLDMRSGYVNEVLFIKVVLW